MTLAIYGGFSQKNGLVGGDWNMTGLFFHINWEWNVIIPIDEL